MRDSIRKWGRRMLWVLFAVLTIYCFGKLANYTWYRTQIPNGFQNANWTGSWPTELSNQLTLASWNDWLQMAVLKHINNGS